MDTYEHWVNEQGAVVIPRRSELSNPWYWLDFFIIVSIILFIVFILKKL